MACLHSTNDFESIFDGIKRPTNYFKSLVSIYTCPMLLAVSSHNSESIAILSLLTS